MWKREVENRWNVNEKREKKKKKLIDEDVTKRGRKKLKCEWETEKKKNERKEAYY